jgi:hypothetical protein
LLGGSQVVSIDFTAQDEGPAGLAFAYFTYRTPLEAELRVDSDWMGRAAQGSFTATKILGPWVASGTYVLEKVEVHDREWNATVYTRQDSPHFDFAAADFTVDNPLQDVTVPTITSARLFQKTVRQGTPAVVLYTAEDDLSGIEEVVFMGWSPTGAQYSIRSLPELGAVGPASWLVPLESPAGAYDTFAVWVFDRAGNSLLYQEDREYQGPPKATVPSHGPVDIPSLDFSVEGVVGDRVAPVMTEFSPSTPDQRSLGDLVALDYVAGDAGTGIEQVAAAWTDGRGHQIDASKTCGDLTQGPISTEIEDFRSLDTEWQLQYIVFGDAMGNQSAYRRDGTIAYQNSDPGPTTHGFDLTAGDFHLRAGEPLPHDFPNTTAQFCRRVANVSIGVDDADVVIGELITAIGEVTVGDIPVPDPIVAIHEYIDGVPVLTDVLEGTPAGTFEESFVPEAKETIKATFLGIDGPVSADITRSRGLDIVVRSDVDAGLSDNDITRGQRSVISGTATVTDDVGSVSLQRKIDGRWKTIASIRPGPDGSFSFSVRPRRAGTFAYRVVKAPTDLLATGRSRAVSLRVRRA